MRTLLTFSSIRAAKLSIRYLRCSVFGGRVPDIITRSVGARLLATEEIRRRSIPLHIRRKNCR